ncbi:hypothetical protein SPWS13_2947 [Shewanella putrefaciens]|nr:hypothetical protein SPWS13_2947 [Shewanella putrefaciens]
MEENVRRHFAAPMYKHAQYRTVLASCFAITSPSEVILLQQN